MEYLVLTSFIGRVCVHASRERGTRARRCETASAVTAVRNVETINSLGSSYLSLLRQPGYASIRGGFPGENSPPSFRRLEFMKIAID